MFCVIFQLYLTAVVG